MDSARTPTKSVLKTNICLTNKNNRFDRQGNPIIVGSQYVITISDKVQYFHIEKEQKDTNTETPLLQKKQKLEQTSKNETEIQQKQYKLETQKTSPDYQKTLQAKKSEKPQRRHTKNSNSQCCIIQ